MKKFVPFILLAAMALLVVVIKKCKGEGPIQTKTSITTKTSKGETNRNRGFDRTLSYIEYSAHAKCRMACRRISQEDIQDIMRDGDINYNKSDVKESPCPIYAVQGYTRDREHLRVIFGQCDLKTKVITCYNLDEEFECDCPGEEKKSYR